ncbi:MAG: aminotransferase class III-fold pyridoxal phosphate-dependent enzyme [Acidobacteriota bacterium]|nr:aminotransferase class III-fold pyridoxal phosphate-dependent enzyme [Acidobacteriota bacterium]
MPDAGQAVGLPFPIDPLRHRPRVAPSEAAGAAGELWGLKARATPLSGERDANFLLEDRSGDRFVLKVSSASERPERLGLQHDLITRTRERDPALRLPEAVATESGALLGRREFGGREHQVRLFRYLKGRPLSAFRRRPHSLLASVGGLAGRVQRALDGFDHPELDVHEIPWAPAHAPAVIAAASGILRGEDSVATYQGVADAVQDDLPDLLALPGGALHNDANDDNLLLAAGTPETAKPEDVALLDFGDSVRGPLICEAATAALYTTATAFEPLPAAARVLAGFAGERPLSESEADLFRVALATRALVSAGVAALRRARVAGAAADEYLMVSQAGVWRVLRAIEAEAAEVTTGRFRMAAGFPPLPRLAERRAAVQRAAAHATPPVTLPAAPIALDLSPESPAIDPGAAAETLRAAVAAATGAAGIGIGRYLEPRVPETAAREAPQRPRAEPATLQLGIEVFAPAGTAVRAPLAGEVDWISDRPGDSGHGVSAGIRHAFDGEVFWTSYRHLDPGCLDTLVPGRGLQAGEVLGTVAEPDRSSAPPPHLQFQVLLGDSRGHPPRRTSAADLPVLSALSADPLGFFGLGPEARVRPAAGEEHGGPLLEARRRRFSSVLSISYDVPIRVVRGRGARLYDDTGRDYLDMVNNVAHVGHAHPRVADAISRQAALLNTNTRYLYRQLTDYAERLADTFPAPLEVVFLTNSGSEANDLALRIARAHLGRQETLAFDGGYHGNLTSLIEVSPYKLDGRGGRPGPPWLHRLPMPDGYRGRFREGDGNFPASLIEDTESRVRAAGPATLIGEAILSCGGQIVPPPGYLEALYGAVRSAGGVIVADEVQTGFGRTGPAFWAFLAVQDNRAPLFPDIVTLGKPAGNGHPLGAVVTSRELARSFETGMEYFNTFGGNPVSCAAGLAVLDVIGEERLAERAAAVGKTLLAGLTGLGTRYPILGQVRGRGLFLGFEMVRNPESRAPATEEARRLVNRLRDFGILNSTDGPDANVIKLKPPLPFSFADAAYYLEVLETVLEEQF